MKRILLITASVLALCLHAYAGFSERKNQAVADSGRPVAVRGATSITVAGGFNPTFEAIVKAFQKADEPVVIADRETGMVATEIAVAGGWKQTGTRTIVTFIKESDTETTVKVAVTVQKRYKALQVEPWSDPQLDANLTAAAVTKIKTALGVK